MQPPDLCPKSSVLIHHFVPCLLSLLQAGKKNTNTLRSKRGDPPGPLPRTRMHQQLFSTPQHCMASRPGDLPLEQGHQFTRTCPPSALWIFSPYLIFGERKGLCVPCTLAQAAGLSPGSPQTTRLFSRREVSQGLHSILAQTRVLPRHSRNSTGKEQYLLFRASEGPSLPFFAG